MHISVGGASYAFAIVDGSLDGRPAPALTAAATELAPAKAAASIEPGRVTAPMLGSDQEIPTPCQLPASRIHLRDYRQEYSSRRDCCRLAATQKHAIVYGDSINYRAA